MPRKYTYDQLPDTVKNLSILNKEFEKGINTFSKSKDDDKEHLNNVITARNNLVKAVNEQFADLRGDFHSGAINLVKYREKLALLKTLTTGDKTFQSNVLNVSGMLKEILHFC